MLRPRAPHLLGAALVFVGAASAQPTFSDLQYASVDGQALLLDIYLPTGGEAPFPVLVWIHGGGWRAGSKSEVADVLPALERGLAIASIDYRLLPQFGFPEQVHDCKGAVRWLRANAATYSLDPDRIGAFGPSAGAYHATMLGLSAGVSDLEGDVGGNLGQSSAVLVVAQHAAISDFFLLPPNLTGLGSVPSDFLGLNLGQVIANRHNPAFAAQVALVELASPVTHVSLDDPPFYIGHGALDNLMDPIQSQTLFDALDGAGVEAVLNIVPGSGHSLPEAAFAESLDFLADKLLAQPVPGDADGDGDVDLSDLGVVLAAFGTCAGEPGYASAADLDASLCVDLSDLGVVLANFGG